MSSDDNIFLAADKALSEVATWLGERLSLEPVGTLRSNADEWVFRGRARTTDGELHVVVEPNVYGEADPEPGDISAIDRYACVASVRYAGVKDEALQAREARAVFDELVAAEPDVAMVLSHNMAFIVAAYLPGVGIHVFPAGVTLDEPDMSIWRPWIVA
jgi:hypothetical protein